MSPKRIGSPCSVNGISEQLFTPISAESLAPDTRVRLGSGETHLTLVSGEPPTRRGARAHRPQLSTPARRPGASAAGLQAGRGAIACWSARHRRDTYLALNRILGFRLREGTWNRPSGQRRNRSRPARRLPSATTATSRSSTTRSPATRGIRTLSWPWRGTRNRCNDSRCRTCRTTRRTRSSSSTGMTTSWTCCVMARLSPPPTSSNSSWAMSWAGTSWLGWTIPSTGGTAPWYPPRSGAARWRAGRRS